MKYPRALLFSILILAFNVFCADVCVFLPFSGTTSYQESYDSLKNILQTEGHFVDLRPFPSVIEAYDVLYGWVDDTTTPDQIEYLQMHIGLGGRAILIDEVGDLPYSNVILSDPLWDDSLGNIRNNGDGIWDWPAESIGLDRVEKFPNFGGNPRYFFYVDTIMTCGPSSFSILSPDSGTARPFVWGRNISYSTLGAYDSFAVMGIYARYGEGELILLGELFPNVITGPPRPFNTANWGDNRQFIRNLFTTNDRADSVWLTGTDSSFTIFLPGSTPFVAGSTYFSFESAAYGLWELHACDWHYWHTDSSITIQYPLTYPMGETFEVCIKLVPDATGETVLPTGEVCDSFAFDYTGIAEAVTPEHFAISAYPNPFNSAVTISVGAIHELPLQIEIFDINGKHITKFSKNESIWRPLESVSSGIYLIRATNGINSISKRVLYIK